MYDLGKYLRQRYGDFLPDEYSYKAVEVKCAAQTRCQESAAVAMAGLFPPGQTQTWQHSGLGALYTPITCSSLPSKQDIVRSY